MRTLLLITLALASCAPKPETKEEISNVVELANGPFIQEEWQKIDRMEIRVIRHQKTNKAFILISHDSQSNFVITPLPQ